jgi:hypothetical protein
MCKETVPQSGFIGNDLFGNEYNCKYPPNREKNGTDYEGYETPNQLTFYYDFCIQQYGVAFYYEKVLYEAEFTDKGPTLTNRTTGEIQGPFDSAIQLLENAEISGRKMICIIDQLDHVVLH